MTPVERRTIEELAALYELEPEVRDVFVEGAADRAVVEWYLGNRASRQVSVVEIDDVDVPSDLVAEYGLEVGNRGRVVALAYEMESRLRGKAILGPTLLADADSDRVSQVEHACSVLVLTDFACLEMYLFNKRTIDKLLFLFTMGCRYSIDHVLRELERVLQRLFVIRLSNQTLRLSMKWISFGGVCRTNGCSIAFDEAEFIRRYLNRNAQISQLQRFHAEVANNTRRLTADPRHQMNGHDFLALLRWFVRPFVREQNPVRYQVPFERAVFACVELRDLDRQPAFQRLLERVNSVESSGDQAK